MELSATGGSFFTGSDYTKFLDDVAEKIKSDPKMKSFDISLTLRQGNPGAHYTDEGMDFVGKGIIAQSIKYLTDVKEIKNVKFTGTSQYKAEAGKSSFEFKSK